MATLTADQEEEIVEIPKEKVGLVIGRKGRTKEEVRRQTGVQIFIKDDGAHLRGTAEQIHEAKMNLLVRFACLGYKALFYK